MSLLGSAFGRALAGAGAGAAGLASKYVDEEIATNRAQALAEIQRKYRGLERTDEAAFRDARAPVERAMRREDALAAGATAREVELAGLNDAALTGARRTAADAAAADETRRKVEGRKTELAELTPAEVEAANAKIEGTTSAEAKRAGLLAEAQARAQAKYREPRVNSAEEVKSKLKAVQDALGRDLSEQEKLTIFGLITKPRDPELDTETVTEERMNPDGTTTKVQRKQVRKPGSVGAASSTDDPTAKVRAAVDKARADGKIAEAIKELRAKGATPAQILQVGITEDELKAASQPTQPRAEAPARAEWRPDPDTPAGRTRALSDAAREREQRTDPNLPVRRAAAEDQARELLARGDKRALYQFQGSDAFKDLDFEMKAKVAAAINNPR